MTNYFKQIKYKHFLLDPNEFLFFKSSLELLPT